MVRVENGRLRAQEFTRDVLCDVFGDLEADRRCGGCLAAAQRADHHIGAEVKLPSDGELARLRTIMVEQWASDRSRTEARGLLDLIRKLKATRNRGAEPTYVAADVTITLEKFAGNTD